MICKLINACIFAVLLTSELWHLSQEESRHLPQYPQTKEAKKDEGSWRVKRIQNLIKEMIQRRTLLTSRKFQLWEIMPQEVCQNIWFARSVILVTIGTNVCPICLKKGTDYRQLPAVRIKQEVGCFSSQKIVATRLQILYYTTTLKSWWLIWAFP
jgi:hypothetical protein